jgi:hypothetical protein
MFIISTRGYKHTIYTWTQHPVQIAMNSTPSFYVSFISASMNFTNGVNITDLVSEED